MVSKCYFLYLKLCNKTYTSTCAKYILSHIINYPDDANYPDDDRNNNLNKLVINIMLQNIFCASGIVGFVT